jgi:hypothetical protein
VDLPGTAATVPAGPGPFEKQPWGTIFLLSSFQLVSEAWTNEAHEECQREKLFSDSRKFEQAEYKKPECPAISVLNALSLLRNLGAGATL